MEKYVKPRRRKIEKSVLNALEQIRPYLQADGGDISLIEVTDENVAVVELLGACKTCKLSYQTLKAGVEYTLKRAVPEIVSVVSYDANK